MALHCCRREGWGRSEGCAGNRPLGEAICNTDADGRCLVVKICHGGAGRKVEATGTRVGNASVGGRKLGGITSGSSG